MTPTPDIPRVGALPRLIAASAVLALILAGCIPSGRTSHPDNFAGDVTCPVAPDPSITTSARIAWQAIPNGDLVIKDLQLLEKCMPHAEISWIKMNSGGDVIQAFGSNSLDIAQVGSSPVVKAASPPLSKDLRVLWISDVIGGAESLIAKDPAVESLEDLSGRTIAVPFGSTAHYSLLTAIEEAGLEGEIRVISLAPDAILAAWQNDEIDAAWIWEPTQSELLAQEGHPIMSSEDTAGLGAPTYDLVAGTDSFIQENPDFLRMWTAVEAEGTRILNEEPELAATSISVQLGVPVADAEGLLDGYIYPTLEEQAGKDYFGGGLADALGGTATFLEGQREIDSRAEDSVYQEMPYPDAIQEVSP